MPGKSLSTQPFVSRVSQTRLNLFGAPGTSSVWGSEAVYNALHSVFSAETQLIEQRVNALQNPISPASLSYVASHQSIEERLFDATAGVKILTSQVAMHLEREWREKLFRQIDSLHDAADWEPGDLPVQQLSFATFLKAICQIKPERRPGLGLSHSGQLIAAWVAGQNRLTIEFLINDRVQWVISRYFDETPERIAGQTSVTRLSEALRPYDPQQWFSCEK